MAPARKTLLIVDDDEGMRDTLVAILKDEYRTLAVGSGEEGLRLLHRERVELVIADVRLPGMSGLDLLRLVKDQLPLAEVERGHDLRSHRSLPEISSSTLTPSSRTTFSGPTRESLVDHLGSRFE